MPIRKELNVGLLALLVVLLGAGALFADMVVTTNDGRKYTFPLKRSEVKEITYTDEALSGGRWELTAVERGRPSVGSDADNARTYSSSDNGCTWSSTFRGSTHLKARASWSPLPQSIGPDEVIPVGFKLELLEARVGPGGLFMLLNARLGGQGWSITKTNAAGWPGLIVDNSQPVGTMLQHTNGIHKSFPKGRKGDKMVYEIQLFTPVSEWWFRYTYEWVD